MKENDVSNERGPNINLSYFTMRETIGWAGLLLPLLLVVIAWFHDSAPDYFYQPSISDYYYTVSGILFIALITLIGAFLISYRGYDKEQGELISDNAITWIAGILILIVATVPTPFEMIDTYRPTPIAHNHPIWGGLHFVSAVGFFLAMSFLSISKFTKGTAPFSTDKKMRNKIYRTCGWGMLITLGAGGIMILLGLRNHFEHIIFWLEVILMILFAVSWLVKGKGLVRLGIQKGQTNLPESQISNGSDSVPPESQS